MIICVLSFIDGTTTYINGNPAYIDDALNDMPAGRVADIIDYEIRDIDE